MLRKLIGKLLGPTKSKKASSPAPAAAKTAPQGKSHPSGGRDDTRPAEGREGGERRRRRRSRGGRGGQGQGEPGDPNRPAGSPETRAPQREAGPPQRDAGASQRDSGRDRGHEGSRSGGGGSRDRSRDRGRGGRGQRDDRRDRPGDNRGERAPRQGEREPPAPAEPREPEAPVVIKPVGRPIEIPAISEDNEFVDLGLVPALAAAVEAKGYQLPTPIQSEAIPVILSGRDVIGSAQTGTGKTAAFSLPILQRLGTHGNLRCLVLEPTRELALQVEESLQNYSKFTELRTAVIYGGVGYGPQRQAIEAGLDIIVATPGRLLDHISQRSFSLSGIEFLVLDEVDRMLDMGFLPDVKRIIEMCPKERQTLFFSATIPPELEKLTLWCLKDPHTIEIGRRSSAAATVSHAFYPVIDAQKFDLLLRLLDETNYESVLIFCRTKHGADFVAGRLDSQGHKVAVMHSNRTQSERTEALKGFKSGKYEVMVATDVAARGLDIQGITHVVNYDTPLHPEDYVHRIGRTGRAQAEGDAFTLLTEDEMKYAFAIERYIGQRVERKKLEGFPYQYSAVFASLEGDPTNVFRSRLYRGTKTKR